jgi:CelD/BcsL family acetyltransferase involved in cellulose biosynthesis
MAATPTIRTVPQLSASVIRTNAELCSLGPAWKELFQRSGCDNVFLSFEWLSQWWFHFGHNHQLFVIAVRDGGERLAALAPFYISLEAGPLRIRRLGFLGDRLVGSDYLDFIVDNSYMPSALECICHCILENRSLWDYMCLSNVRAESIAAIPFRLSMEDCSLNTTMGLSSVCPYERLPKSPDEYFASLTSGFRKSLRYYSRTLQREGQVEFITVDDEPDIEIAFNELLRLHRARFEMRGASSAFLQPQAEAFHRTALPALAKAGWLRIHILKLRGQCIAASYELSSRRKLFFYQSGIDPDFARFSVGQLLIHFAIEQAIQHGYAEFDFLRGNEPYKSKWVHEIRAVHTLQLFDRRGKSRIAWAQRALWTSLRPCKTALLSLEKKVRSTRGFGFLRRTLGRNRSSMVL